ncbi:MAG: MBL fold metallo-hydrolase [bacterium]
MASDDQATMNPSQAGPASPAPVAASNARATIDLKVRFWGVRGSYPVPGPKTVKYGGNTSCVEIRNHHHRIILDAGTGIIGLGDAVMSEFRSDRARRDDQNHRELPLTILLSHTHHDHIQALPFFLPAYFSETCLYVFGPQSLGTDLRESIAQIMTARYCPIRLEELNASKIIKNLADSDCLIFRNSASAPEHYQSRQEVPPPQAEDVLVTIMRSYAHPKDGVFIFKIAHGGKRVVYATDTEGYLGGDARLIEFAQGADLLVHDAQYTQQEYADPLSPRQGFGHSTIDMACEVARKAGVRKLILFHHDPRHSDDELDRLQQHARSLFAETYAACEGMEIVL